jgi:predicted ribosomally synthesized peptide with nif11-like leader
MSIAELERFEKDVHTDTALMTEVKAAGTDEKAVVAFAKSKGYDFTVEELLEYVKKAKASLSDEDLDKVAGGAAPTVEQVVMINPVTVSQIQTQTQTVVVVEVAAV